MAGKKHPDPMALTAREARFVLEMLTHENATEAYLKAGYTGARKSAHSSAARLLASARVKDALEAARTKRLEKLEITADEAYRRLACIAGFDIGDLVDDNDQLLKLKQLPPDVRRCIKSVERDGTIRILDVQGALMTIAEAGGKIKRKGGLEAAADAVLDMFAEVTARRAAKLQGLK